MSQKPTSPKGMRDFGPQQMARRNYIIDTIKQVYQNFGFMPLETPAMENLSTLTGKYGDEGDQLLYKVLNSGDFLSKINQTDIESGAKNLSFKIAEKGLKYDLTVPFARFVVANQHDITFPFKRYQIQPVWRADRPQKGRYREFYQCDADVVGTESLICEAEIILMIKEVFKKLNITDYTIKINHREILSAIAEVIGAQENTSDLFVAIDKLDKIGIDKVVEELITKGVSEASTQKLIPILSINGNISEVMHALNETLAESKSGIKGLNDIKQIVELVEASGENLDHVMLDVTLARGLSYYTGAIFEVQINNTGIGSVSGGGRYDNLTGMFGLDNVSGVGFSFGIDRLYDCLETLNLFNEKELLFSQVLIVHFDEHSYRYGIKVLSELRKAGISSEIYPEQAKLKKQFGYADKKNIPFTIAIGSQEMESGKLSLKNMKTGEQLAIDLEDIIRKLSNE